MHTIMVTAVLTLVHTLSVSVIHLCTCCVFNHQVALLRGDRGSTSLYGLNRRDIDLLLKEWCSSHRDMLGAQRPDDSQLEAVGKFMMAIGNKLDEPDGKYER